eukprot:TRINITY_DN4992_c0_g1_i2.p1 TRINITY_DN4992_c0_g1~~TRINITY_DN4992_c0_g1_i2.p1  ORF type:complete len:354 (-),score=71.42 TRINITY_DN4992_c0_g1_i2:21-1082(-)
MENSGDAPLPWNPMVRRSSLCVLFKRAVMQRGSPPPLRLSQFLWPLVFAALEFAGVVHGRRLLGAERMLACDEAQMERAFHLSEEIYKRNVARRSKLFPGAEKGMTFPYSEELQREVDRSRWGEIQMLQIFYIQPLYSCPTEERVGVWGEGGKWVCVLPRMREGPIIIYSVGSKEKYDFEEGIKELLPESQIFTFDPSLSPEAQQRMLQIPILQFFPFGVRGNKGRGRRAKYWAPDSEFYWLGGLMKKMEHKYVDVLKIDCEGCEAKAIPQLLRSFQHNESPDNGRRSHSERRRPPFGQILIEVHGIRQPKMLLETFRALEGAGYRLFHAEENVRCNTCRELAYVHHSLLPLE